jgi:hypothetical protein
MACCCVESPWRCHTRDFTITTTSPPHGKSSPHGKSTNEDDHEYFHGEILCYAELAIHQSGAGQAISLPGLGITSPFEGHDSDWIAPDTPVKSPLSPADK